MKEMFKLQQEKIDVLTKINDNYENDIGKMI